MARSPDLSCLRFCQTGFIGFVALGAEIAGWAVAAAIAPGMTMVAIALITGMGLVADYLKEALAADFACQAPSCGLVDPHQRRVDNETCVHAEVERELH